MRAKSPADPGALPALRDRGVIRRCCSDHAVVPFRPDRRAFESKTIIDRAAAPHIGDSAHSAPYS
jgi:hypothetical protein